MFLSFQRYLKLFLAQKVCEPGVLGLFCLFLMRVLFLFAQFRNALPVRLLGSLKWRDVMTVLIGDPLIYAEDVSLTVVSATLNNIDFTFIWASRHIVTHRLFFVSPLVIFLHAVSCCRL